MTDTSEFLKYFESKYDEISEQSRILCDKKTEINHELFHISKDLFDFINNRENLINPPEKIILSDEFRNFLVNCLSQNDLCYIHSPLHYSTEDGKDSFYYAAPETHYQSYLLLVSVYVWCKHFTDQGYSGILPIMNFD